MRVNSASILIGGRAGDGVMRAGRVLSLALVRAGLNVFAMNDYPSLIRGGRNFFKLRAEEGEVRAQRRAVDVILALDERTVELHAGELEAGGAVVYDSDKFDVEEGTALRVPVPMTSIAKEAGAPEVMRNSAGLGAVASLIGLDFELLEGAIRALFPSRWEGNVKVAKAGYESVADEVKERAPVKVAARPAPRKLLISGNEAAALAAIAAGVKLFASYPITPATPLFHAMATLGPRKGVVVVQTEDEMAAALMALGAAFAGVRSLVATSGPGFDLMVETVSLAGMVEYPLVIIHAQRQGPSTGLATKTAQGDLLFSVFAGHGEFPKLVVAPGDAEEAFLRTVEAVNLADKYQVPAVVLLDKHLAESYWTVDSLPAEVPVDRGKMLTEAELGQLGGRYARYELTDDGVSPRAPLVPVEGVIVKANSSEHDERGYTCSEPRVVASMMNKRFKKLEKLAEEVERLEPVKVHVRAAREADVAILCWGSVKGAAIEAARLLEEDGVRASVVQVVYMWPFPKEGARKVLEGASLVVAAENNKTAQLAKLVEAEIGVKASSAILRYDGRPLDPEEIRDGVVAALRSD